MGALDDLRVLDLSGQVAGPFCTKLLADFGADVIRADLTLRSPSQPGKGAPGDGLRGQDPGTPPLVGEGTARSEGDGRSAFVSFLNAGKRSVTLDIATAEGIEEIRRLVREADIVVESFAPGVMVAQGLGFEELEALRPGIILTSVAAFGQTGAWRDLPADELIVAACSGWASVNGRPDQPPLKPSGYQASFQAGIAAFDATMAAVVHRDRHGIGQHVDVSLLEPAVASFAPGLLQSQYRGQPPRRQQGDFSRGPVPARDGYFSLTLSRAHFWRDAMNELGLPELAHDQRFYEASYRQEHHHEVAPAVEARLAQRGKRELFERLGELRVVGGMVLSTEELFDDPHVRAREFFVEQPQPDGTTLRIPGAPFKMSATPWAGRPNPPAPFPRREGGASTWAPRPTPKRQTKAKNTSSAAKLKAPPSLVGKGASERMRRGLGLPTPLTGIRAIVLTQAWAGTFATQLLGLLGAEVIQVEARQRLDSWRGGYGGSVPAALRGTRTAVHPWNTSPLFNSVNLNKQGITLDLSRPEGRDLYKRLVPFADVVAENFSPRVMGNLGLDYASLRQIKPDIILLSMSAYGATGPYANIPGIGGTIEPMAGMSSLLGYEDGPPINSGMMYPDPVAGYFGVAAVLIALHHRQRTGEGQYIDLSMQETNMTFIADALMEYSATGRVRGRMGNRHPTLAPHGIYRAAHAGESGEDERWVAISVGEDAAFGRLCQVAGHPEWAADPRFVDAAARKRNEDALDALIDEWTSGRDAREIEAALRGAGVMAAMVRDADEVLGTEHLWQRGVLTKVAHPEAGVHAQMGAPWRLSRTPGGVTRPAPCLGEHSREVLARFLGIDDAEYERLAALGITGMGPPD